MTLNEFLKFYIGDVDKKIIITDRHDCTMYNYTMRDIITKEFLKAYATMRVVSSFDVEDNQLYINVYKPIVQVIKDEVEDFKRENDL